MRLYLFLVACLSSHSLAIAESAGYTLHDAPWSNKRFEVCSSLTESGLQPVLFEPKFEDWSYTPSKMHPYIYEAKVQRPAYYLIEQKIGYLNGDGIWVNNQGESVLDSADLESRTGERIPPTFRSTIERMVKKSDFARESADAMAKIEDALPCSIFAKGHYNTLAADITYDFGSNNPYQCDAKTGLSRSTNLNSTETVTRQVVTGSDSANYYVKFPDGDVKVYRAHFPIWEVTHTKSGDPICPWFTYGD